MIIFIGQMIASLQKWAAEDFPVLVPPLSIMSQPAQNPQMMTLSHIQTPKPGIFKALHKQASFPTNHSLEPTTCPRVMTLPPEFVTPRVLIRPSHSNQLHFSSLYHQSQLQAGQLLTGSMILWDCLTQRSQVFTLPCKQLTPTTSLPARVYIPDYKSLGIGVEGQPYKDSMQDTLPFDSPQCQQEPWKEKCWSWSRVNPIRNFVPPPLHHPPLFTIASTFSGPSFLFPHL